MSIEPERQGRQQSGSTAGPTVLRIALGGQLRRLREERGISREAAGDAIRGSHAKISRLELGRVSFRERDLNDLLTLYGVQDSGERAAFLSLARQANEPGWWHQYGDLLPSWFETYLGLEQAAEIIRTYEAQFVPGLLQTPDYARAVILLGHGQEPSAEVDRRVALRMRRQDILTRGEPPTLWAVIDEAALRRPIGGERIMRGQIEHLIRISELPNVTVQLLPYSVGGHAAAGGPFTIVRFPESDLPDVVYLEQLTSALYLDKRNDLDQYQAVMNLLSVQAATPQDTTQLLRELMHEY
ncbi:helix-turn-helix domain-containing protein [Saccharopolyspora endophytica]|uniref:Helix-turn-helix domain-containing protein n=1 Tax=Saccharopolyspora endophytica TaxID=543886 RepID=A0ABS5DJB9_9PSEU|nr:helix-turn-helix transcriptional regulator [Saccharopolyspora endophytica]MBQ0926340.1 helix-turn-helix domain-containing protein [Saccharopolyspora endophytica]